MPLLRLDYPLPLVLLLQVSLLPMLRPALGAYLCDRNQTVMASMPAYPISFSNTTFFLDRVPLYVMSKAEADNSCEVKDFPNQWPFVVFVHEETTCGGFDNLLEICDHKGCLGVIFAPLLNPSMAGWLAHIAGTKTITSRTPAMTMGAFPGPQLDWLLREGASQPPAVLISIGPNEYNEGAAVLSSWKFRSMGIIFSLYAFANIVAVLCKFYVKILDLRDGKKMQTKPGSPLNKKFVRGRWALPTIDIWHPLFVLLPELLTAVLIAAFWINIMFFRAHGLPWNLFRVCLTAIFPFTFISTFTTAFIFSRITLQHKYSKQRSWAHKLAGSLYLRMVFWVVVLADVAFTTYTAITNVEVFRGSVLSGFYTIMQFCGSIYFIVGGKKMVALLSKGGNSSESLQTRNLQFANRVWFCGIAMFGFSVSLTIFALSIFLFPSATSFWYLLTLSTHVGQWVNSAQIRAIVVRRENRTKCTLELHQIGVMPS